MQTKPTCSVAISAHVFERDGVLTRPRLRSPRLPASDRHAAGCLPAIVSVISSEGEPNAWAVIWAADELNAGPLESGFDSLQC
jgi:hypothetical protein